MNAASASRSDTGLACHLSAVDDWATLERQGRTGALVETWVASEVRKMVDTSGMDCKH